MLPFSVRAVSTAAAFFIVNSGFAADYEITQKDKKFNQVKMAVKVGDVVNFRNEDPYSHNIYSLSDIKTFDLGSYPKGQSKAVTFDKPGTVEIECAIHPDMMLIVEVKK